MLATSRVRLNVYGEHEYALPPMAVPPPTESYALAELARYEGVQLFVARVRHHQPGFELTAETATAVAAICRRMEGVPLALELAAARTRQMPLAELAAALRDLWGETGTRCCVHRLATCRRGSRRYSTRSRGAIRCWSPVCAGSCAS